MYAVVIFNIILYMHRSMPFKSKILVCSLKSYDFKKANKDKLKLM